MVDENELRFKFREQQERYVYYLIALAVTALGFSVYKTSDLPLRITQIPLAAAVFCWGLSIYFGLIHLKLLINLILHNLDFIRLKKGEYSGIGNEPRKIQYATELASEKTNKHIKRAVKCFAAQQILFYCGVLLFIVWHVIEMSCNTKL